jgi:hypothetical protein
VPGGVVNVLTGRQARSSRGWPVTPTSTARPGRRRTGATLDLLEAEAAGTLKRVRGPRPHQDWAAALPRSTARVRRDQDGLAPKASDQRCTGCPATRFRSWRPHGWCQGTAPCSTTGAWSCGSRR